GGRGGGGGGGVGGGRVGRGGHRREARAGHAGDIRLDDRRVLDGFADTAEVGLDHARLVDRAGTVANLGRADATHVADAHVHETLLLELGPGLRRDPVL